MTPARTLGTPKRLTRGFTLVEMMVAATLSLLLVIAMVQFFSQMGGRIVDSRATMEMSGQLRSVAQRLQLDLQSLTVQVRPWAEPGSGAGYFELFEGIGNDLNPDPGITAGNWVTLNAGGADATNTTDTGGADIENANTMLGDFDDVFAGTIKSYGQPFRGRWTNSAGSTVIIESQEAEVVWWSAVLDVNANGALDVEDHYVIFRRVLLIRPDLNLNGIAGRQSTRLSNASAAEDFEGMFTMFFDENDISARFEGSRFIANSLVDLTKRENRFVHAPTFPHPAGWTDTTLDGIMPRFVTTEQLQTMRASLPAASAGGNVDVTIQGFGKFVMTTSAAAFDLRVYDPTAPVRSYFQETVLPGDLGFASTAPADTVGLGAFVDLGWAGTGYDPSTPLRSVGTATTSTGGTSLPRTYCTWSLHYEHDGIDQDGLANADQGTNGRDDNDRNGVDDVSERETSPPYPVPLNGVQAIIRVFDPGTRQVRQTSVVSDFVPE